LSTCKDLPAYRQLVEPVCLRKDNYGLFSQAFVRVKFGMVQPTVFIQADICNLQHHNTLVLPLQSGASYVEYCKMHQYELYMPVREPVQDWLYHCIAYQKRAYEISLFVY